ncbi:NAD-dependent epimerase/dehydratase family protein [Rhodococcus opacus]|uniref:NAD-dependent epimerase/dehydratase family protein n=1 Tax=Rhodococcus opacus TaxID=37919 RepID=UPI001C46A99B|nr:NAD-dependent epimerase/dehydratase family protein [Rhodococcus opacus]MBV6756173.1 NAD-dependent epimerase/dehydratase family protein [Rhodococcus opacus]
MRILVLGAGGYLGSALVKRFVSAGNSVTGLVRNDSAAAKLRLAGAQPVSGDLADPPTSVALLENADVIVFAAQLLLEPERRTVEAMLDALAGSGKTFVFTSGTGVLSQRTDGEWSEDTFAEDDDFVSSKYIGLRRDTENLVRSAGERGIRGMVVRPAMIWGHGGCPMIEAFYRSAAQTGSVCYIGRGLNLYSNVHVDDVAEVYHLAIEKGAAGALYHAVSGETNFRTLAEAVARELNVPTRSVDLAEAVTIWDKFTALIAFSVCSRSRAPRSRTELGWEPHPDRLDIFDEVGHPALRQLLTAG